MKATYEYQAYLKSATWKKKRQERLSIDNHACVWCGATKNLQVHHLTYSRLGNEDVEKDLCTLCFGCHKKIEAWKRAQRRGRKNNRGYISFSQIVETKKRGFLT